MLCETIAEFVKFPSAPMELKKVFAENAWKLLSGFKAEHVDVHSHGDTTLFCIWSTPFVVLPDNICREDLRKMFNEKLYNIFVIAGLLGDAEIIDTENGIEVVFRFDLPTDKVKRRMYYLQHYDVIIGGTVVPPIIQTRLF